MSALTISTVTLPSLPSRPRLRLVPVRVAQTESRPARAHLRLTRRGRLTVTLVLAAVLVVAGLVSAHTASAGSQVAPSAPTEQVLVLPGQTLWSIAQTVDAGADPRDVIAEIRQLNGLETSAVSAGQTLVVPAG